jgi:hypothetical protein
LAIVVLVIAALAILALALAIPPLTLLAAPRPQLAPLE